MVTPDIITFDELTNGIESETSDNKFKTCAEFLMTALNDWPTTDLIEPKDLLDELQTEINKPLTFDNLDSYLKRPTFQDSWKMESLTSLCEMFDFDRNNSIDKSITLETIIIKLTNHYRVGK